jgi:transposase
MENSVEHAVEAQDLSHVTKIGTDETSSKRGHNYVTIFMDADQKVVICATEGKNAQTVKVCKEHLETHGGYAENSKEVYIDMSPAFIKGFEENFPNAAITFDKFHVIKNVNEAVDEVRRKEQKTCSDLKYTRYIWLKNEVNLTAEQKKTLDKLKDCELQTTKAYRMKICLQELFRYPTSIAPMVLQDWIQWGLRCRLEPMVEVTSRLNNGLLEGVNSLIQAAKRKARGYRSVDNLIAMIYLIGGKLRFDYPTVSK